ncbi:thiamine diphosphokinase [Cognatitamlana onchidii]|uniref:thiamine diphosphokinase n=1 Tax=Cognatitamlana onchidii TaxID=2562860 RepID=UPI0010A5E9E7|nr:thiamine diphosphokinase [Algibacter onchidii]
MNKTALLLLNGEKPNAMPDSSNYGIVCATDGAYKTISRFNIKPDFISGDLDSLTEPPKDVEIIHTPNQNYTDFDKVLKILFNRNYVDVHVYGASGKEQDHFMGNLHTALQWKNKIRLTFFDNYGYYFLARPNEVIRNCLKKHVSLVPMPSAEGITTIGLQYPLLNETLRFGDRLGTRNIAITNHVEIAFKTGDLFIFIND